MKYRAEIDGLRAVAVIPVIFFHAGFDLFKGGFVGVDVFFVISGYLITTILIEDIENNRFSLIKFYERRARRILPALFLVMFVCLPFSMLWMMERQFEDFSQSLVATSLFASNIFFWQESDYFAVAGEEKPLLHTWSLAVEEQYYLVFPVFLLLIWRFGKSRVVLTILAASVASLLLSEWAWRASPNANFFLAPTRAWELLTGSMAAFIVNKLGVKKSNIFSLLGLGAIVFSIVVFDETTPFPSIYALVPVLGTFFIVLFADKGTVAAKLLGTKALVGLGLISYSAYLWHQPLFAFARIRSIDSVSRFAFVCLAITSLVLAYFSWRWVEKPFRRSKSIDQVCLFSISLIGLVFFFSVGLIGHFGKLGSPLSIERFEDWRDHSSCVILDSKQLIGAFNQVKDECLGKEYNFILIGDSHAETISRPLRELIEGKNGHLVSLLHTACLPILGTSRLPLQQECVSSKRIYWEFIQSTNAEIILSSRWRLNLIGPRFDNKEGGVEYGDSGINYVLDSTEELLSYVRTFLDEYSKGNKLIIVSQIPEAGWHVPERHAKLLRFGENVSSAEISTSYDVFHGANSRVLELLHELSHSTDIEVVRPETLVCDTVETRRCFNTMNGRSLYRDDDHPSPLFAELIAAEIVGVLKITE